MIRIIEPIPNLTQGPAVRATARTSASDELRGGLRRRRNAIQPRLRSSPARNEIHRAIRTEIEARHVQRAPFQKHLRLSGVTCAAALQMHRVNLSVSPIQ